VIIKLHQGELAWNAGIKGDIALYTVVNFIDNPRRGI